LLDVIFLEEIYHKFLEILKAKNRTEWYLEEMQNFISKNLSKPEEALSKHFSFKHKSARQISQTKSLILWRERWAKKINIPRQHLIKDEAIEDLVTGRKINFSFGAEMILEMKKILEETEENFDKNLEEKPAQEIDSFMSAKQKNAYLEAKKLIGTISLQENFKEQFLVTSYDLKKVICAPKLFNQTIRGWRYQLFGKQLEQLL
jgi:ribonuclease D